MVRWKNGKRALALMMATIMTAACAVPVQAAAIGDGVAPTYDEAYYATLDYYGNLMEGSVVKSYALNGAGAITDYGSYDEVVNLTDNTPALVDGARTTFQFSQAPSHFYFEGKTAAPFQDLPWTVTLRYTLNGVPAKAEDLAGKTGVVEILLDIVPNEWASDYARYNYTLEAMALFNEDDILSLEAEGAQVQLVGNLRTVLFMCLPGEEQHFTIRVGSDDFSFSGMTILMVPATLAQLEEIAKLSQRKDDLEEDYRALSGSLDALLDALNDVQGGLYASANGLDQLDIARGTISAGKGTLYDEAGVLRGDLSNIADLLEPVEQRTLALSQAITDSKALLNGMTDTAVSLKSQLEDLEDALEGLEDGTSDVRRVIRTAADLENSLRKLKNVLGSNGSGISVTLPTDTSDNVKLVKLAHSAYSAKDLETFGTAMQELQKASGSSGGPTASEIGQLFGGKKYMTFEYFCTKITGSEEKGKDMSDLWTVYSGGKVDVPEPLPVPPVEGGDNNNTDSNEDGGTGGGSTGGSGNSTDGDSTGGNNTEDGGETPDGSSNGGSEGENGTSGASAAAMAGTGFRGSRGLMSAALAGSILEHNVFLADDFALESGGTNDVSNDTNDENTNDENTNDENTNDGVNPDKETETSENKPDDAGAGDDTPDNTGSTGSDNPVADVIVDRLDSTSERLNQLQSQLNRTLEKISHATGSVVGDLAILCGELDDLVDLIDDAEDLSAALRQSSGKIRKILDDVDGLRTVLDSYEPVLQESVANMGTLSTSAVTTLRDLETLLADTESLMKEAGGQLDSGTHQALRGLAATLRQTAKAMAATGDVKDAKTTIAGIIEDTWHEYTGDINNILMMDATAEAVSLTDSRNAAPSSIQVLIRTQEIKVEDEEQAAEGVAQKETTTFWGRIAQMFKDFWSAITGIFR